MLGRKMVQFSDELVNYGFPLKKLHLVNIVPFI